MSEQDEPFLVQRLRLIADCKVFACVGDDVTVRQAADEILRLTKQVAELERLLEQAYESADYNEGRF